MLCERDCVLVIHKRSGLIEDPHVASLANVRGGDERQPEIVIAALIVETGFRDRVPPVVDAAVDKLVRRVEHDLCFALVWITMQPDLAVLELIAEAVGAGLLVVPAPCPDACADRLVREPMVVEQVEVFALCFDIGRRDAIDPSLCSRFERVVDDTQVAELVHRAFECFLVFSDREDEGACDALTWTQRDIRTNGCTWIRESSERLFASFGHPDRTTLIAFAS